jgi:cytochrome c peroxidase
MTSRDGLAVDARRAHPAVMPGTRLLVAWALLIATVAGGAGGARAGDIGALSRAQAYRQAAALTALGRRLFLDPALSASGAQACASCHDPAHAFGPPDGAAVRLGGRDMRQPGLRAVPSLMYLQATPQFAEHFFDEDSGDDSVDNGPTGGLTWDGRADRGRDQARLPLLSRFEMANRSAAEVVARVRAAGYDAALRALGGAAAVRSPAAAFDWVLRA